MWFQHLFMKKNQSAKVRTFNRVETLNLFLLLEQHQDRQIGERHPLTISRILRSYMEPNGVENQTKRELRVSGSYDTT